MIILGPRGPRILQPQTLASILVQRASASVPLVSYVDPTQVTVVDTPSSDASIDPTRVAVVQ